MATALIGLGSNLDDRAATLDAAVALLDGQEGIELVRRSQGSEYPGVGGPPGQSAYLNAAVTIRTSLPPQALLAEMNLIEQRLGRTRDVRWGSRTLDLDLLLYDDQTIQTPSLIVPHPRLAVRRFVLEPAAEIAGDMLHPGIGWTIARLLTHLREHPRYVALAGPIGAGKTQLGRKISAAVSERYGLPCRSVEEPIDDQMLSRFYADPTGRGPDTELEFLRLRAPLLTGLEARQSTGWVISDFWFGQALAYGELWLKPEDRPAQRKQYEALAAAITPPKLLVLLDAPLAELRRRIAMRGRPYEQSLTESVLENLRQNINHVAATAYVGPMLRLSAMQPDTVIDEVVAAMAGME
ncbi:MAG: 2-amino-4-hydroxy-6-hydroxymethyldihydropteridine diphosphokinase [Planctomycetes bacterium]|nr:2-amino-4-hydroxy-6-hydroxymethyldihydropteridine diphosphokinase [Planctomycetota bacterium]